MELIMGGIMGLFIVRVIDKILAPDGRYNRSSIIPVLQLGGFGLIVIGILEIFG